MICKIKDTAKLHVGVRGRLTESGEFIPDNTEVAAAAPGLRYRVVMVDDRNGAIRLDPLKL